MASQERAYNEKDRDQQNGEDRTYPKPKQGPDSTVAIGHEADRVHDERITERNDRAHRPQNHRVNQRLAQAAFAFMIENASAGRVKIIVKVSMSALMRAGPRGFPRVILSAAELVRKWRPTSAGARLGVVAVAAASENLPTRTADATGASLPSNQDRCR